MTLIRHITFWYAQYCMSQKVNIKHFILQQHLIMFKPKQKPQACF